MAGEVRGRDCVQVAMAATEPVLAVTTIRAISPLGMWESIRDTGGGDRATTVGASTDDAVFGASDRSRGVKEQEMRGSSNFFLPSVQQSANLWVPTLLRAGCQKSYPEAEGTSQAFLRNGGIKIKELGPLWGLA